MSQLGRYIIDNPEPPGAMQQLRGNINRLGGTYLQKQMTDRQRKQELEDAIELMRKKAEIEQELNPMAGILKGGQGVDALSKMAEASTDPNQKAILGQLAAKMSGNIAGRYSPQGGQTMQQPMQVPTPASTMPTPNIQGVQKPVFGQSRVAPTQEEIIAGQSLAPSSMIREKMTTEMTPFGDEQTKGSTFISPEAEEFKTAQAVRENLGKKITEDQYSANKGVIAMYGQLKSLMSYKAAQFEEAGGDTRPQIIKSWIMSKIKQPGYGRTGAFFGSQAQTAMRSTPLITGSVRIVRDITKMMFDALPNVFDPGEFTANKSVQSLDDFFRFAKGIERAGEQFGWTKDEKGAWIVPDNTDVGAVNSIVAEYDLSAEDEELKNTLVEDLLAVEPAKSYQMKSRGQQGQQGVPVFGQQPQQDDEYQRYLQVIGR